MDYYALLNLIENPDSDLWRKVDVELHIYRDWLYTEPGGRDADAVTASNGHYYTAVYTPDISLTIAWGIDLETSPLDGTRSPLIPAKGDPLDFHRLPLSRSAVDVFWNSALVHRQDYYTVDGGRAYLPIPTTLKVDENGIGPEAFEEVFRKRDLGLIGIIDDLDHRGAMDGYIARTGLRVVE